MQGEPKGFRISILCENPSNLPSQESREGSLSINSLHVLSHRKLGGKYHHIWFTKCHNSASRIVGRVEEIGALSRNFLGRWPPFRYSPDTQNALSILTCGAPDVSFYHVRKEVKTYEEINTHSCHAVAFG